LLLGAGHIVELLLQRFRKSKERVHSRQSAPREQASPEWFRYSYALNAIFGEKEWEAMGKERGKGVEFRHCFFKSCFIFRAIFQGILRRTFFRIKKYW